MAKDKAESPLVTDPPAALRERPDLRSFQGSDGKILSGKKFLDAILSGGTNLKTTYKQYYDS
jgi:hypothetical protein